MSGFFIGIDVGGTNLKAGLTDETGRLLAAARRPLDFRGAETFAADLADLAAEFGLFATGGSDFHGANKPQIVLGALDVPEQCLTDLKAWLGRDGV